MCSLYFYWYPAACSSCISSSRRLMNVFVYLLTSALCIFRICSREQRVVVRYHTDHPHLA